jgi:hypothetical protein
MALLSKPSSAARIALVYITAGALIGVWTGIWLWWLREHPPANESTYYWAYGFLLTGATLLVIGFCLGRIGRAARHAELPPAEATPVLKSVEQNAALRAPVVVPASAVPPGTASAPVVPPGQVPLVSAVPPTPPAGQPTARLGS